MRNATNTQVALNVEVIVGAYRNDQLVGEVRQYVGTIESGHTLNGAISIPVSAQPTSDYCRVWWDDSEGYTYHIDLDRWGITYPESCAGWH